MVSKGKMTDHTTVGDKAAQMQAPIPVLGSLHGVVNSLILRELALLDRKVDADDVLPHDSPGANVEMADLGIAHETLRETDGEG